MVRIRPLTLLLALSLGSASTASHAVTEMEAANGKPQAESPQGKTAGEGSSVNSPGGSKDNDASDTGSNSDAADSSTGGSNNTGEATGSGAGASGGTAEDQDSR